MAEPRCRRWVSVKECAAELGVGMTKMYALIYGHAVPYARLGTTIRIDMRELERQLEAQEADHVRRK